MGLTSLKVPELLAPAGDWECVRAAVENGADAIYFGLDKFNARMRAHNFTEADLPELMRFLHQRGVRGYVTFNTLVFSDELAAAEQYLRSIIAAGVDAVIVQDIGICRLIRSLSPDFPIHGSTQMTITSAAGVEFARKLGCELVVLARECSIKEIETLRAQHEAMTGTALPVEVFVHGALCVAYSGQCLTSEALGGRSANRGECAQACRMPYELISDGKSVPLGDRKYLLSPQDLAGLEVLPDLIRAGVSSLKIEGRLKAPEYVASITKVYREAIDRIAKGEATQPVLPAAKYEMEMAFSRGLYSGWFRGINNQELVHARFGKKRGVYLGKVARVGNDSVFIQLEAALKAGDGIVFDAGTPEAGEQGGRVFQLHPVGKFSEATFMRGAVDFSRIQPGELVWKTSDSDLEKRVRQTFADGKIHHQRPLDFEVHGRVGTVLTVIARDEQGHVTKAESQSMLAEALQHPLDATRLADQLGRLGQTPYRLGRIEMHLEGRPILPVKELNELRRRLVESISEQAVTPKRWELNERGVSPKLALPPAAPSAEAEFIPVVRNLQQLDTVLEEGAQTIYCELEDTKKYREAMTRVRSANATTKLWVIPPRITKTGEEWILKQVRSCEADGYLVRNYDHLQFFKDCRRRGDFSFNVANEITAEYLISEFALERVTASYDLNMMQLAALLRAAPPAWFDITLHQHMPMFHMEHCVFCAFLTKGTDFTNCGRPCDTQDVRLRDRAGAEHPLKADAGCRNTVYHSQAQTGAEFISSLTALGARQFRIEFLNETPEVVRRTLATYRKLMLGEITGRDVWRELKLINQLGVTRGQLVASTS